MHEVEHRQTEVAVAEPDELAHHRAQQVLLKCRLRASM